MSMQEHIEQKVRAAMPVLYCTVENESGNHSVPRGSETHFRLVLVSDSFAGLSAVKRHQLVYGLLREELSSGVHALALHTYTPEEWRAQGSAPDSPACRGGSKAG
jgi:BolA protein